ncbi:DUF982 domain-containing protein [Mesorhizobium sp. M0520]
MLQIEACLANLRCKKPPTIARKASITAAKDANIARRTISDL